MYKIVFIEFRAILPAIDCFFFREASEDDFTERLHWPPTSLKREDTGSYILPKCDRTTNKKFWLSRPRSESESRDLLDPHQKTIINTDFSM